MGTLSIASDVSAPDRVGVAAVRAPLSRAARLLLLIALIAACLAYGGVQTWVWASMELVAVAVLVLWAVGVARQETVRIVWSPMWIPAALFLLLVVAQLTLHLTADRSGTREAVMKLTTDLIILFIAAQLLCGHRRSWRSFGFVVWAFTSLLSLFSILQFFTSEGKIFWATQLTSNSFGSYVNRNHYAGLMEMLIPVSAAYVLSRRSNYAVKAALGFTVLIAFASVLISGSRGGFVSLFAEVFILGFLAWRSLPRRSRQPLLAVGAIGVAIVAAAFFWLAPAEVFPRLAEVAHLRSRPEVSITSRIAASWDALRMFKDHPLIGTGAGSFEAVYPQYQSNPTDLRWDHAHNDYAEALAETGLLGGVIIAAALILFFRLAFRDLRERLQHRNSRLGIGAALGCCGMLVHSLVDFNLHIPANAAWFAVCLACSLAPSLPTGKTAGPRHPAGQPEQDFNRSEE